VVRTRGATGVEADRRSALCDTRSEKRGPSAAAQTLTRTAPGKTTTTNTDTNTNTNTTTTNTATKTPSIPTLWKKGLPNVPLLSIYLFI
jgi:hypothetical protein